MYINSLRKELKFTRGCQDEILLCKAVIDPLFKYDVRKKSLDTNNLTFLVYITFLELQGSGKKKMLLLAWQYECEKKKKCWIKINLSVPLKMKMSPKILSPSDQILAQTLLILIWAEMQLFEILELLYCMLYLIRPPTSFHA